MNLANRKAASALRHRAEKKLARDGKKPENEASYDALALIHELQVHQIELEMQNEELRRAQAETDKLRRKFEDLYNFAPIGYLTLDKRGLIRESNLAAASCLGITRDLLKNAPFISFLTVSSVPGFRAFLNRTLAGGLREECEVKLLQGGKPPTRTALIEGVADYRDDVMAQAVRVAIIDITEHKQAEEALRQSKEELEAKSRHLEELNIALRVVLDQRDKEKRNLEEKFSQNIDGLILPYLEKIRKTGLNALQEQYLHVLEANLRDIVKPFSHAISGKLMRLSPTELRIMNLVKQGLSIKNIASMLHISPRTVEFHRDNLRKKLGITERRINLRTFLSTLE